MPNADTQDYVIKTDGGTFRIRVPKGMEQAKALSLAAATNPKFAEIYPQVQARMNFPKAGQGLAPGGKQLLSSGEEFPEGPKDYISMSPTGIATSPRIPLKTQ